MAEILDIVEILYEKTQGRRVPWQWADTGELYVRLGEQMVELENDEDNSSYPLSVKIRDKNGKTLDVYYADHTNEIGRKIGKTYDMGKRQALKVDERLEDIKKTLNAL